MDLWWLWSRPVVAGVLDGMLPNLLVAAVTGGCAVMTVLWLAKKRWEPALQHLTTLVDREMQGAERAAQALHQRAQAQSQRVHRQAASVHGAIAGVRALQNLTEELDQCATDLNHLAQLMAQETHRQSSPGLARHVVSSAKQLAMTAEQARITYRRLQSSVSQLLAESASDEQMGDEMAQHARELTGAVQRLRDDIQQNKAPARHSRDPRAEQRDPAPREAPREVERERPRDMPTPRHDARDDPRYAEPRARASGRDRDYGYPHDTPPQRDERPPRGRDEAPLRGRDTPPPRRRDADDESSEFAAPSPPNRGRGNAGPTHRRDRPAEFDPRRLPDITERPARRDDGSGWLSDHYPQQPYRRDEDAARRRR